MRAVFLENTFSECSVGEIVQIESDQARHLIKVIRIKKNEQILILNGQGVKIYATVVLLDRKELSVHIDDFTFIEDDRRLNLFLGIPKKEAFENIVKMASEIGVKNIYLYRSKYSQFDVEINERILKIEESAMLQSNNPYKMIYTHIEHAEKVIDEYDLVINFSTFNQGELNSLASKNILMMIGPEAGFSKEEEDLFNSKENVTICRMPTNILRAPTALAVGAGYILGKF